MATLINSQTKVVCLKNDVPPPPTQFFATCIHKCVFTRCVTYSRLKLASLGLGHGWTECCYVIKRIIIGCNVHVGLLSKSDRGRL